MDTNKLKVLRDLRYQIHQVCGNCIHADRFAHGSDFSKCTANVYRHEKHTASDAEGDRYLSINRAGSCRKWEPGSSLDKLEGFAEFAPGDKADCPAKHGDQCCGYPKLCAAALKENPSGPPSRRGGSTR